jgi:hypothetical protein
MPLPPGRRFLGEKPPMRRATDRWIVLALLGITIWGWTQTVRLLLQGEPWFFVLPIAVGAVLVTIAEANLIRLWWWWRRKDEKPDG